MKKDTDKTNVMRVLDQKKIEYQMHSYENSISGTDVARELGEDPACVFKTLVTTGHSGGHYVFVIPVERELHLKKAAKCVGEKSIEMLKQKELLPLTGYIHGGCSPIGMKKLFPTVMDESALQKETVFFSAGKIGKQVQIRPEDITKVIPCRFADLCV